MDEVLSLMQSLHVRLDKLEASMKGIFDIEVAIKHTDSLKKIKLRCSITGPVKDDLVIALKRVKEVTVMGFTCPSFKTKNKWEIDEIELKDEILYRDSSNGQDCLLLVCKGVCRSRQSGSSKELALKFRRVEKEKRNEHFSEQEAAHALLVDQNNGMRPLFSRLYCVSRVMIQTAKGEVQLWECIGSELMREYPYSQILADPARFYSAACRLLKKMHESGYIHSDAHQGNFMLQMGEPPKLLMIDQDEIKKLSDNPTVSKFMQIMDYWMLLYHGNPYIYVYDKISQTNQAVIQIFRGVKMLSALFPPVGFVNYRDWTDQDIKMVLTSKLATHPVEGKSYWDFLEETSTEAIDDEFEHAFSTKTFMVGINATCVTIVEANRKPTASERRDRDNTRYEESDDTMLV